jgi:hypothetical protein
MNTGRTVFAHVMELLPLQEFHRCVERYRGDCKVQSLSCLDQFLAMAFAQLTYRESLRDIEACLQALQPQLYHMGFRSPIRRNTLVNANKQRDWRIYADFARVLIARSKPLYAYEDFGVDLEAVAYGFDSTTIHLCLALCPWARYQRRHGAIKLHSLLDLRGSIPDFVYISDGKLHDVNALDYLVWRPGAFYIMDRGYVDFLRLYRITQQGAFFVVRARPNMDYIVRERRPVDRTTGLLSDHIIVLRGVHNSARYPIPFRRVRYHHADNGLVLPFITNNLTLPALTISQLYRSRWHVELFFRWIKKHLRVKAFYGFSENAVKTQVWIALATYVLVAILRKRIVPDRSLYNIPQILSITACQKVPVAQALATIPPPIPETPRHKQLSFIEL